MRIFNFKNLIAFILAAFFVTSAQTTEQEMFSDIQKTASIYYTYKAPNVKYTKAPKGYKPFYLSHYGRHGSRFHNSAAQYASLYQTLARADSANALTKLGKSLLTRAKFLNEYASPRAGDLTQLGVAQQQDIANRMVKNFPAIFKNGSYIEAYASTSLRCTMSMSAFLQQLRAQKPKLDIHQEASKYLMKFIAPLNFDDIIKSANTQAWQAQNEKLYSNVNPMRLMNSIFNDSNYIKANVNVGELYSYIYEIGGNLQNIDEIKFDFSDLFTKEELFARWQAQNAWWYNVMGNSPLSLGVGLSNAKPLLKNIIEIADKIIADTTKSKETEFLKPSKTPTATLRFGHDVVVLPLAALLQLDAAKAKTGDMQNLYKVWTDYKISPMAANVQIIFYESNKKGAPVLVKVMLNEIEQNLPIECPTAKTDCPAAPYYRWSDFREFYTKAAE